MDVNSMLEDIERRDKQKQEQDSGSDWRRYGLFFLFLLLFLVIGVLVVDKLIMPAYVGLGNVIRVPNVEGMSLDSALMVLRNNGLEPKEELSHFHKSIPEGHVVSQLPYPKSEVKKGRRVYLVASKGRQYISMPTLRGVTLRDARITLMRNGLRLNDVSYVYNDTIPANYVFYQGVPPRTKLDFNAEVDVVVSLGPEITYVSVPNLVGKTLSDCERLLKRAGLSLGFINRESNETFISNTIIDQFPFPGDQVEQGAAINVSVNFR